MTDLPTPLTPPNCNLKDFQFIPVDVDRLLKSETWVLGTGDERAAAITLWMVSWHEVPAASLPKDDRMLAHLSQSKNWKKVKAHALRGWIEASDGRLYHPVVAEKALEAWIEKLANSISGAAGNAKRWGVEVDIVPLRDQFVLAVNMLKAVAPESKALKKKVVVTIMAGSRVESPPESPPDDLFASPPDSGADRNRQGQGQGQLTTNPQDHHHHAGSTGDDFAPPAEAPLPPREDPKQDDNQPAIALTVDLRKWGVNATFTNPDVQAWAANPLVTRDILAAAVAEARETKGNEKLSPRYLVPIVDRLLNPPAAAAPAVPKQPTDDWYRSKAGIERKGRELGLFGRGNESHDDFKDRIFAKIRKGAKPL